MKFIKQNPVASRTVEVRGDQTPEDLPQAIFNAFAREDEHMYEFQICGKGPMEKLRFPFGLHPSPLASSPTTMGRFSYRLCLPRSWFAFCLKRSDPQILLEAGCSSNAVVLKLAPPRR
jgi:hypothetical protein